MKKLKSTFLPLLLLLLLVTTTNGIKDAPRRTTQKSSEQRTVKVGENVKMNCPIEGNPLPIYEWTKGGTLIPEDGWARAKPHKNTLKLFEVTAAEQDDYVCSGINGFGKEIFTFSLTVTDPLSSSTASGSLPNGLPPEFTQLLPPGPGKIDKPVGHNVKLKCQVSGVPEPSITWFKDGKELHEGSLDGDSRLTRHYLHLLDLRPVDAGTYTCAAANPLGAAAANWTLRVIDQAHPKEPEFNPLEPANTTVMVGRSATLQCSGNSEVDPHIKWLRRLEDGSREADHIPDNETLNWKDHRYIVLQATQVLTQGDGSFYTKLVIPRVTHQDGGVYVCTATNNFGIAYKQAHLSVYDVLAITETWLTTTNKHLFHLGNYSAYHLVRTTRPQDDTSGSNTLLLVVGLACVGVLVIILVIIVMVRRIQKGKPPPPLNSNESALLPPPHINQAKIQLPPSQHPRYVPGMHNAQQQTPHGHSVGPEGPLLQYAGGMVHLPPQSSITGSGQGPQPIIVYQDPATAASVYIAQRPSTQSAPINRPEYQYQHLDVI